MAKIKKRTWTNKGGRHEAWQLDFTDKDGKRHREQFSLKRDAENRLADLQGSTRAGTYRPIAEAKRVGDACDAFLQHMKTRHARNEKVTTTYLKACRQHCQNWIDPAGDYVENKSGKIDFKHGLGSIKLADLRASHVVTFRDEMRNHGAGIVTTRRVIGTLSRILKHAAERDMIASNVAKGVRVTGTRDEDREKVKAPARSHVSALLQHAEGMDRLAVMFAAQTGLRASEQWALRWRHLDLDAGRVTVQERVDAFGELDTTKSKAGNRTVPMGKALIAALKQHRETTKHGKESDFVFTNSLGGFIRHTNHTKRTWLPLIERAGIEPIGWHSLRHFAVSAWIAAGFQPKEVQTLAGHASFQITMTTYGHMWEKEDHQSKFDAIAETFA